MSEELGEQNVNEDAGGGADFAIPEEYSGRGWTEKISSYDDLFKSYDNAQSMLGKRQVPGDDASPEDWGEFYKKAGRPDDPTGYQFSEVEGIPEGVDMVDFEGKARAMMHEAGLSQRQADNLYQAFLKSEMEAANANKEALSAHNAELDKQFDEVTNKLFDGKFDEVSEQLQATIVEAVPEEYAGMVADMAKNNPKQFAVVLAMTDKMTKQVEAVKAKYGSEDSLTSGQQAGGESKEELLKSLMDARDLATKSDPFSPDRRRAEGQMEEIRKKLQAMYK